MGPTAAAYVAGNDYRLPAMTAEGTSRSQRRMAVRTRGVSALQIGAATDTSFGVLVVVGAAVGTGVIGVSAVGTEAHAAGEFFGAVRTIDHLHSLLLAGIGHGGSRCSGRNRILTAEGGLVVLRLHHPGHASAVPHAAHHVDRQQTSQQPAGISQSADGRFSGVEHLLLLPGMAGDRHGGLLGDGLLHAPSVGRGVVDLDRADIELRQPESEVLPEGVHRLFQIFGEGI